MKQKWLWITIALVLIGGVAWAAGPAIKNALGKGASGGNGNNGSGSGTGNAGGSSGGGNAVGNGSTYQFYDLDKMLYKGINGPEVKELQNLLNIFSPANKLVVDGNFGSKTEAKLKAVTPNRLTSITLREARALLSAVRGISTGTSTSSGPIGWWSK